MEPRLGIDEVDDGADIATISEAAARALNFAAAAHSGQPGKLPDTPYIAHPVAVARIVAAAGLGEPVVVAALLHDVVEKTEHPIDEVATLFGRTVAAMVAACSEDAAIPDYPDRKRAHREQVRLAGPDAVAIYAADKLANLRDVRRVYGLEGEDSSRHYQASFPDRIALWRGDLAMAREVAPGLPWLTQMAAELEAFQAQRLGERRPGGIDNG